MLGKIDIMRGDLKISHFSVLYYLLSPLNGLVWNIIYFSFLLQIRAFITQQVVFATFSWKYQLCQLSSGQNVTKKIIIKIIIWCIISSKFCCCLFRLYIFAFLFFLLPGTTWTALLLLVDLVGLITVLFEIRLEPSHTGKINLQCSRTSWKKNWNPARASFWGLT